MRSLGNVRLIDRVDEMSELVNCDMCGRDTTNKSRICRNCMKGASKHWSRKSVSVDDVRVWREIFHLNDPPDEVEMLVHRVMMENIQ